MKILGYMEIVKMMVILKGIKIPILVAVVLCFSMNRGIMRLGYCYEKVNFRVMTFHCRWRCNIIQLDGLCMAIYVCIFICICILTYLGSVHCYTSIPHIIVLH